MPRRTSYQQHCQPQKNTGSPASKRPPLPLYLPSKPCWSPLLRLAGEGERCSPPLYSTSSSSSWSNLRGPPNHLELEAVQERPKADRRWLIQALTQERVPQHPPQSPKREHHCIPQGVHKQKATSSTWVDPSAWITLRHPLGQSCSKSEQAG